MDAPPQVVEQYISERKIGSIRRRYEPPIIAIIGAKRPTADYDFCIGFAAGGAIREWIVSRGLGYITTGGSAGVGVDAYCGVVGWCSECNRTNEIIKRP